MTRKRVGDVPSLRIEGTDHRIIHALLPEYVMIRVLDQQPPLEWAVLQQHLDQCDICRSEAEALTRLMLESYGGPLPASPVPPDPDVSFLHPTDISLSGFALPFSIRFSPALVEQSVLSNSRQLRGILRYQHTLPKAQDTDPDITFQVLVPDDQADYGLVRIMVEYDEDNLMNQAPLHIFLRASNIVHEAVTDPRGIVSFENVPLADIVNWEIVIAPIDT